MTGGSVTDRPPSGRTYVVDTSVLLADPSAWQRFDEHEVVVPLVVLTELEAKRHHPELGWAARQTLRMLEDLRVRHGSLLRPMPANEQGGTLRVEVNHTEMAGFPAALTNDSNDHRILAVARNLASEGREVAVVTKDLPLRLKASIVGLEADEYRNELAVDSGWNGVVELDVEAGVIDALFSDHVADLAEARDLPCNSGLVLHAGPQQSALGRVHADKRIHLARSDRALFDVRGRSAEQRIAIDVLADQTVGIVSLGGPAGTGKSVLALAAGLDSVIEQRTHNRVIVFRPIFPVGGQDLGYLPGSETEKMMPWGAAVTDALEAIAGSEVIDEVFGRGSARGAAAHAHPGPQPDRQLRHHRRGAEPRALGASHGTQPARPGQPRGADPRRRPAGQPARGPPRRRGLGDRDAEGSPPVRPRIAHPRRTQPGGRAGHPGARWRTSPVNAGARVTLADNSAGQPAAEARGGRATGLRQLPTRGRSMFRRGRVFTHAALLSVLTLVGAACSDDDDSSADREGEGGEEAATSGEGGDGGGGGLLAEVQDRGTLNCGVNETVPGFGLVDEQGEYAGFDIEFCKAVAAAVLGDAEAVEYTPLDAETRFPALQSGEIDVLIRNTTYTASRDGGDGARFLATTFFDGQGMMVRADSGFQSVEDMNGTTICVLAGTTTELNLATRFQPPG